MAACRADASRVSNRSAGDAACEGGIVGDDGEDGPQGCVWACTAAADGMVPAGACQIDWIAGCVALLVGRLLLLPLRPLPLLLPLGPPTVQLPLEGTENGITLRTPKSAATCASRMSTPCAVMGSWSRVRNERARRYLSPAPMRGFFFGGRSVRHLVGKSQRALSHRASQPRGQRDPTAKS